MVAAPARHGDEHSADDLEVARILSMLPHLVWEAQHPRPCTHNLRWGATKRRSAGSDEARPAPPCPRPLHHTAAPPPALENSSRKRGGHHARPCPAADSFQEKATAASAVSAGRGSDPAVPETSTPETPLDFCPSCEERDAQTRPRPPDEGRLPTKKPKSHHRESQQLARRMDLLVHERTELQKEAVEARNRLEAERWRYSELVELRVKMEEARHRHHHQLPLGRNRPPSWTVGSISGAHDQVHRRGDAYPVRHLWPKQWMDDYPVVHQQPTTLLPLDPKTNPPAGEQQCKWVAFQPLGSAGSQGGSRPCRLPDLNTRVEEDLAWS